MCPSTSGARRSWRCAKPGSGTHWPPFSTCFSE
ncbi:hypothetical protein A306_00008853 [Columba livia]|uniref:Uncharacterized protein n=1 Tax=Columba livia TaxID=8932 RepID=A0A2I0M458_COLLI|nr:hypothetical protein A306_00008853 [Columba livia]